MNYQHRTIVRSILIFAAACAAAVGAHAQTASELVAQSPANDAAGRDAISAGLVKLGVAGVKEVCAQLLPAGDDSKARFALNGLVHYSLRAGAEADRLMVVQALAEALAAATDNEIKAFLISQLQLAGKDESIAVLKAYLTDERLCDPAVRALQSNPTQASAAALAEALTASSGKCTLSLVKALGDLQYAPAMELLAGYAVSEDLLVRKAASYALANIGVPEAETLLMSELQTQDVYERIEFTQHLVLFAQRRAAAGDAAACERICRALLAERTSETEQNVPCSALTLLYTILGEKALPDLLAAMDSPNAQLRGTALLLAQKMPGGAITTREWVRKYRKSSPEIQREIMIMLAHRPDKNGLESILRCLTVPDIDARVAAAGAAAAIGVPIKVLPALINALRAASDEKEIAALKTALLQLKGEKMVNAVAEALEGFPIPSRIAGLEILAARRASEHLDLVFDYADDADPALRKAAIIALASVSGEDDMPELIDLLLRVATDEDRAAAQQTVVTVAKSIVPASQQPVAITTALQKSGPAQKAILLRALVALGGPTALQSVIAATHETDPAVQGAAIRALADWPEVGAGAELLQWVQTSPDPALRPVALAGYIRLARVSEIPEEDKVWMYAQALPVVTDADGRKALVQAMMDLQSLAALQLAASLLDDPAVQADAAVTAANIALPKKKEEAGVTAPEAIPALQKASALLTDAALKERLDAHIAAIAAAPAPAPQAALDESGFVPLFNGKDLTGWTGDMRGYTAEFGKLVCQETSHLNLFSEKPYGNFVFRFEFKLTPGANNGIGIRTPLMRHAAYDGMEIQILDDTSDLYKDLKDYQFHGSIYGVVPAQRGHLKPVGEWNYEEIIAQGRHITVNLNGATIVDVDLDQAAANGTPDEKDHPGLKNESGHLAFLGHGSRVEFRNIRIKELN